MSNRAAQIRQTEGRTPSRRGRRFVEFDLGGGQKKLVTTIEPLHRADGTTEIDTAWTATSGVWQHEMLGNDWQVRAKSAFNGAPLVEWSKGGHSISLQPQQLEYTNGRNDVQIINAVTSATATITDDLIRWPNAFGTGRHFQFIAHPSKLIKHLVLDNVGTLPTPSAQILGGVLPVLRLQFVFAYSAGLTAFVEGVEWAGNNRPTVDTTGAIEFRDAQGAVVGAFAPVTVWDAALSGPTGLVQRVQRSGPNLFVEVRVPLAWLQAATFPVYIDPTFTDGSGGDVSTSMDTSVLEVLPTANWGATVAILFDGDSGAGNRRVGLVRFDLSSISASATCDSATFYAYQRDTIAGSATIDVHSIASGNSAWTEGSSDNAAEIGAPSWNHRVHNTVTWAGSAGLQTSVTDYEASSLGSFVIANDADGTEYSTALTASRIQGWFGGSNTNYGISLRTTTPGNRQVHSSDGPTGSLRPKLVVVYTTGGGAPVGAKLRIKNSLA